MKTYEVRFSQFAEENIDAIKNYYYRYLNASYSERVTRQILDEISSLETMPNRIPLELDEPWHSQGYHHMVVGDFIVYFRVMESIRRVEIDAVCNGKLDQKKILMELLWRSS